MAQVGKTRPSHVNLADLAYDRLEEMIVTCALPPGKFLAIQDLQDRIGLGRTPVHQAVSRLSADTLMVIRPRHGLQIAPIDLQRERILLPLLCDMERFVVRLATTHLGASSRNQLLHIARGLRDRGATMTVEEFNLLDRRIDQILIAAAGIGFLDHTLQPLHTIFRRIGWIYHSRACPDGGLGQTLACHLQIVECVVAGRTEEAVAAIDALIDFIGAMLDVLGRGMDPALFDCNMALLETA